MLLCLIRIQDHSDRIRIQLLLIDNYQMHFFYKVLANTSTDILVIGIGAVTFLVKIQQILYIHCRCCLKA